MQKWVVSLPPMEISALFIDLMIKAVVGIIFAISIFVSFVVWFPQQQVVPLKEEIYKLENSIVQPSLFIFTNPKPETVSPKDIADLKKGLIDSETAVRTGIIQGLGGLALLVTAFISFLNLRETRRNVKATEEKQIADRFSKAVELLGIEENIHANLGGIYALEQIAEDGKYYWQVMETLTAYVRVCSPLAPELSKKTTPSGENTDETEKEEAQHIPPLATDIQAVLTVLSRCKRSCENQNQRLDLRETDLRRLRLNAQSQLCRAILSKANLEQADFRGTDLQGVDFTGANLQQVTFLNVKLQGALLNWANLQNAYLQGAELQEAELRNAKLQNTDLQGKANLEGADFARANLEGVMLREANLKRASLKLANLKGAWLDEANLQQADLRGANMQGANLCKANLQEAIFWKDGDFIIGGTNSLFARTNLEGANLQEADLSKTDLRNVDGLTWKQLEDARSYEGALLPDYLNQE